jgi:hypothetical protein
MGVLCFFSPIFSYFCLFVAAFNPCHGRPPRRKYMNTWPSPSRSSRRDCSSGYDEMTADKEVAQIYLFRDEYLYSCNVRCPKGTCARGRGYVVLSLDRGNASPCQSLCMSKVRRGIEKTIRDITEQIHTDYIDDVGTLGAGGADEEVIGLDIAVNEGLVVDGLYAGKLMREKDINDKWEASGREECVLPPRCRPINAPFAARACTRT